MIHPDSELRFVGAFDRIWSLFATRLIPKGTITWAGQPLDQIISPTRLEALPELLRDPCAKIFLSERVR